MTDPREHGAVESLSAAALRQVLKAREPAQRRHRATDRLSFRHRLDVGYSVRTVAQADVTAIANLIEARLLAGQADLFERMRTATARDGIWSSETFFAAKIGLAPPPGAPSADALQSLRPLASR